MAEPLRADTPITNEDGTATLKFRRLWETMFRRPVFVLAAVQEPSRKGELTVQATSDTSLTFRYRGSDGIVRSASLTLA